MNFTPLRAGAPPCAQAESLAAAPGIAHGFFGRQGGVSQAPYGTLNAGPGSRDAPANVAENRARIAGAFGLSGERLVGVYQVHSSTAWHVTGPWPGERPQGDAVITDRPGLLVCALAADCAPILLADPQAGVVGAAHAGWRGALGDGKEGIIEAALEVMARLGGEPARTSAAIGPCIHQPSYEVGPEFASRFAPWEREQFFVSGPGDRLLFDLPSYCVARLQRSGVNRIEILGLDTYRAPDLVFSHRRSAHEKLEDYGRNCAAIMMSQN